MGPNQNNGQYNPGYGMGMPSRPPYDPSMDRQRGMSFQNFANQNNQIPQQSSMDKFFPCKVIDNPDAIMPIDVPSNGDPAFFVMRDFSCIYARAVNSRGTIDNVVYAPVRQQTPEDIQREKDQEFRDSVFARFSGIENMLNAFMRSIPQPVTEVLSCQTGEPETPKSKRGAK